MMCNRFMNEHAWIKNIDIFQTDLRVKLKFDELYGLKMVLRF